jgi:hypothetical protein
MVRRLWLIGLALSGFMLVDLVGINPSYAASNEELEARIKQLEEVVLGHKRHPEHPLTELNITGGLTGVIQGSGDVPRWSESGSDWDYESAAYATGSMDLVIEFPIANDHLASVFLEAGAGDGLQPVIEEAVSDGVGEDVELLHGTNDDAIGFGESGESDVHVLEAWFEGSYFDERLTLTVGKVDLTNYLETNAVANDETAQFLSSGFVNNLVVDFPDDNGPGMRLTVAPLDLVEINLGVADAGAEWDNIFDDGFGMLEVNLMSKIGELEGNYRLYGWLSDKDQVNFADQERYEEEGRPDAEYKAKEDFGYGYGISADQQLPGGLTVFGRIGVADDDIYAVKTAWSAGARLSGGLWNRPDDVIAFAYGEAILNEDHPDWQGLKDEDIRVEDERQLEVYYSLAVNENIAISPDVQLIMNPAGVAEVDDIWVFGTRVQINFF